MHRNRIIYDYPEYQAKLRRGYTTLGLVLRNSDSGNICVFRPVPATPFLPEGRQKYFYKLKKRSENLNYNKKYSFATLTYSSGNYTPAQAAGRLKHDIDLFFKRLNYRKSKPEYFYVIELTDKLMPHIHIIFAGYVHKKKIFKSWFKVTGCTAVKIKSLPQQTAIHYCLKYLSNAKKQSEEKWAFIFRYVDRIWTCSRRFFGKNDQEVIKKWIFDHLYVSSCNQHDELFTRENNYLKSPEMEMEDLDFLINRVFYDYKMISWNWREYNKEFFSGSNNKKQGENNVTTVPGPSAVQCCFSL